MYVCVSFFVSVRLSCGGAAVAERAPGSLIPDQRVSLGFSGRFPGCHTVMGPLPSTKGPGRNGRELVDARGESPPCPFISFPNPSHSKLVYKNLIGH